MPPPYHGISMLIRRFASPRRLRSRVVSIASECSSHSLSGRYLKSSLSNPPSLFPVLWLSPSGSFPVSAMYHVERISSSVQRASPSASGAPYSPNARAFIPDCNKPVVLSIRA